MAHPSNPASHHHGDLPHTSLMQGITHAVPPQPRLSPSSPRFKPDPMAAMAQDVDFVVPQHVVPPPFGLCHQRQSVDKSTRSSSKQHAETHIGLPHAGMQQDVRYKHLLTPSCPFTAQSTVTTTTTITTTVTVNMSAHPGDPAHGNQPWFSTNTRTDTDEATTVSHQSHLIAAGNPNLTQIEEAFRSIDHFSNSPPQRRHGGGRRRSFDECNGAEVNHCQADRSPVRRSRRTSSTPAAVDPAQLPKPSLSATVMPLPQDPQVRHTPLAFIRLSHVPKSSDLIFIRLLTSGHHEFDPSGEFLIAIAPKHATTATGEILVSPISLPHYLSHINLEDCRLSFSWLSGERVQATTVSDPLSSSSSVAHPPQLKRPKLE